MIKITENPPVTYETQESHINEESLKHVSNFCRYLQILPMQGSSALFPVLLSNTANPCKAYEYLRVKYPTVITDIINQKDQSK